MSWSPHSILWFSLTVMDLPSQPRGACIHLAVKDAKTECHSLHLILSISVQWGLARHRRIRKKLWKKKERSFENWAEELGALFFRSAVLSCISCNNICLKAMAPHSSTFDWRIPGTGEPGWLPSMGSHRVGHNWSDLAAAVLTWSRCSRIQSHLKRNESGEEMGASYPWT